MADNTPYFVMAFADPKGDLLFVEEEKDSVEEKFYYLRDKIKINFDFVLIPGADNIKISNRFSNLQDKKIALFHFSGHASQVGLKLLANQQTAVALSAIIDKYDVKILFLNACCTSLLVKEIFENTKVSAIIATNDKVRDGMAKKISVEFYKFFIENGYSLKESFKQLYGVFEDFAVNSLDSKLRYDDSDDEVAKLSHDTDFKWGIFCNKDETVLNHKIDTLFGSSLEAVSDFKDNIKKKEEEIRKLKINIDGIEPHKNEEAFIDDYKEKNAKLAKLKIELQQLQAEQKRTNELAIADEKEATKKRYKEDFEKAVLKLNYFKQRGPCNINSKTFAGITILGDKENMPDLFFRYFKSINNLNTGFITEIFISFNSNVVDSFWWSMARELKVNLGEIKQEFAELKDISPGQKALIIKSLIADHYLNGTIDDDCIAVKHIMLIISTSDKQEEALVNAIREFWTLVDKFISDNIPNAKRNNWERKMICVLNDDNIQPGKEDEWNRIAKAAGVTNIASLQILPAFEDITEKDIKDWIILHDLMTVGLKPEDAALIFKESKGKIKKVLTKVKNIVEQQDQDMVIGLLQNL